MFEFFGLLLGLLSVLCLLLSLVGGVFFGDDRLNTPKPFIYIWGLICMFTSITFGVYAGLTHSPYPLLGTAIAGGISALAFAFGMWGTD